MSELSKNGEKPARSSGSEVVSTRVNVAFPFSAIKVEAPTEDMIELAALVRELAQVVADVAPSDSARDLAQRADALVTRLK
jgi:hypothetical protein